MVLNVGGYSCDVTHESDFSTISSPMKIDNLVCFVLYHDLIFHSIAIADE